MGRVRRERMESEQEKRRGKENDKRYEGVSFDISILLAVSATLRKFFW